MAIAGIFLMVFGFTGASLCVYHMIKNTSFNVKNFLYTIGFAAVFGVLATVLYTWLS